MRTVVSTISRVGPFRISPKETGHSRTKRTIVWHGMKLAENSKFRIVILILITFESGLLHEISTRKQSSYLVLHDASTPVYNFFQFSILQEISC